MATNPYMAGGQNLGMGAPSAMRTDWNSYFDGAKPGSSTAWGGGTLTMGDNGEAKYAAQGALNGGVSINRNSIDNPNSLQMLMAQAPGIAQQWKQQYGVDAGLNANDQSYWNNALSQQGRTQAPQAQPQAAPQQAQGQPTNPYMAPQGGNLGLGQNTAPGFAKPMSYGGSPVAGLTDPNSASSGQNMAPGFAKPMQYGGSPIAGLTDPNSAGYNPQQGQQTAPGFARPMQSNGSPIAGLTDPNSQGSSYSQQTQGAPMQTPAFDSGRSNPWIAAQGQALTAQSNQNLLQNVLPSIGRGAQASGMYGSSRQGIAEGQAMGNAQTGLNSALAGMYSQAYGQDQQYDLGLRSNDLGYANLDANINNSNFNNQLQGGRFGMDVYDMMSKYNSNDITNSTTLQNTPLDYFKQFNQNANQIAGQGGTSTNSQTNPGNPYIGALGGLQLGSQLFGGAK